MSNKSRHTVSAGIPPKRSFLKRLSPSTLVLLCVLVVAAIPFGYGKYYELAADGPFDGSMNIYIAQCLLNGQIIDDDIASSARPATLLVNIIGVALFGYSELGPKIIQMLMQIGALGLMFYTLKKLYGLVPAGVALFCAAFFLSCPPYAKYGNVKEQFMICCMIVAACGLMLHHQGRSWRWLVLSGAAAINIYFFKPTGASVMIAMAVYLILQPVVRHRTWRQFGSDLLGLFSGAVLGTLPLIFFYLWQGKLVYFLTGIPFVGYLVDWLRGSPRHEIANIIPAGGYVQSSKAVSTFSTQYDIVIHYYHAFIVPIGLAVLACFWRIQQLFKSFIRRIAFIFKGGHGHHSDQLVSCQSCDYFVVLLAVWWLLDMLFVWISPRSYVEYYLPLNASAAMLAGWTISQCQKKNIGYFALLLVWLLVDLFTAWVVLCDVWPFVRLRSEGPEQYWRQFALRLIPGVLTVLVLVFFRTIRLNKIKNAILFIVVLGAMFWWIRPNIEEFRKRVGDLHQSRSQNVVQAWQQAGSYIHDHSEPSDGLFVWGWYPGIYVKAQRFCPLRSPAFSDMHTTSPESLSARIGQWVKQLESSPPKFIVDPQKVHYPFYDHPVFDLWPRWADKNLKRFDMRYDQKQNLSNSPLVAAGDVLKYQDEYLQQVERVAFGLLTRPQRPGGPMDFQTAADLARREKQRHQGMLALREFVVRNYIPIRQINEMLVFQRKDTLK